MDEKVIEVKNLSKNFGAFEALKDISFSVNKGDVFGFLGPNGAGKSTTLRCMLSLIKPDTGSVRIFGKTLSENRREILTNTGCIIEKPDFYKYLSAEKNLEIFSRISGKRIARKEIQKILEFVNLKGRERDKVGGYSHGMKQRLGIAQALIHDPQLIVLDEPTTGLDPQGIIDMRNLILRLKTEQHKTVLLSSHLLSEIEIIANRMVIINNGRSIIEGNVNALLNSEDLIIKLEVDNVAGALEIISGKFSKAKIQETEVNQIKLTIGKSDIPLLNKELVEKGIQIFSIESRRKLEDYFIKIVKN